jgi:hypothetical protein
MARFANSLAHRDNTPSNANFIQCHPKSTHADFILFFKGLAQRLREKISIKTVHVHPIALSRPQSLDIRCDICNSFSDQGNEHCTKPKKKTCKGLVFFVFFYFILIYVEFALAVQPDFVDDRLASKKHLAVTSASSKAE